MASLDPEKVYNSEAVMGSTMAAGAQRLSVELSERARHVASQFSGNAVSPPVVANGLRLAEFVAVVATGLATCWLYVAPGVLPPLYYTVTCLLGGMLTVVSFQMADAYQMPTLRRHVTQFGRVALAWCGVFAVLALVAFFARVSAEYSRIWFALWFAGGFAVIAVLRTATMFLVRRWAREGRLERRAVIVGGGRAAEELIAAMEAQPSNDVRICGIFDDRSAERSPPVVAGYPKLGTVAELVEFGRLARIDMLIVSLPITAEKRVLQLLRKLWVLPVDIRLSARSAKLRFRPRSYSYEGAVPFLDVFDKPIADWDSVTKRAFDIVLSLLGLVALAPVFAITALAVKLDSRGPVLFRQKRYGFNNEVIDIIKFRSMKTDECDADAQKVVTRGDPRVTRVGRFIRKASIDELPQLVNVLRGELSLVGPRPHALNAHTHNQLWDEVIDGYFGRHKVKPGVTGWAQINGWRGEVDTDEKIRRRIEHDLYYIENWSLWFDLWIVLLTPIRLLDTENAY